MFATTISWVMVKIQLAIHLSLGTLMRLAIRKHAQRSRSNKKASKAKARPITNMVTKVSKLLTNQQSKQLFEQQGRLRNKARKTVHKVTNKQG